MDIQELSAQYAVRKLTQADIDMICRLMEKNPQYFLYCPPMATRESIQDDMRALPPQTTYEDKYYIGYFMDDSLVAVMDLILNYPNRETAFIGFFMMNQDFQGRGIGTKIIKECELCLKKEGFSYIRLGIVKGNPQSKAFWLKNGFSRTGVEDVQEKYTVVIMNKEIGD